MRLQKSVMWLMFSIQVTTVLIGFASSYEFDINDGKKKVHIETNPELSSNASPNATKVDNSEFRAIPERFERLLVLRNKKLRDIAEENKRHPETPVEGESQKRIFITNINKNVNDFMETQETSKKAQVSNSNAYENEQNAYQNPVQQMNEMAEKGYHNIYMTNPDFYRTLSHTLRAQADENFKKAHPKHHFGTLNKYEKAALNKLSRTSNNTEIQSRKEEQVSENKNQTAPAEDKQIEKSDGQPVPVPASIEEKAVETPASASFIPSETSSNNDSNNSQKMDLYQEEADSYD